MWALRAILIALVLVCVVLFGLFNSGPDQTVDVHLIGFSLAKMTRLDVPLITVVAYSVAAGVFVSLMLFISVWLKQSMQLRATRRRIRALEGEVTVLRNRPIEESADMLKPPEGKYAKGSPSVLSDVDIE
ncbi:MAG: LapA family protein [bacterium]